MEPWACADHQLSAATVSAEIARHSNRAFVPLEEAVAADQVEEVPAEVSRIGTHGAVDRAREELADLSRSGAPDR